ncbi:MAG: hypothetical protein MJZ32_01525 [Bacteroidaceae bacterium]|nr:hypothetical protein [Bacteroidaceae bacterium]
MKQHILSTIILAFMATTVFAQNEKKDTTMTFHDIDSVVISDNGKQVSVAIKGAKNNKDTEFLLNEPSKDAEKQSVQYSTSSNEFRIYDKCSDDPTKPAYFVSCNLGIDLGIIKNMSGGLDGKVNSLQSIEISWLNALQLIAKLPHRRNAVSLSLGFTWRNFRRTDAKRFIPTEDESFYVYDYPEGSKPSYSRFKVFSISVPLLWEHTYRQVKNKKGKTVGSNFQLGAILNFNNYSSLLTKYDLNDKTVEEVSKLDALEPISIDLYGAIDLWKGLGIYVRTSLTNLTTQRNYYDYKTSTAYVTGTEMRPVSIGVKWGF